LENYKNIIKNAENEIAIQNIYIYGGTIGEITYNGYEHDKAAQENLIKNYTFLIDNLNTIVS
jgi:hypothetical protein